MSSASAGKATILARGDGGSPEAFTTVAEVTSVNVGALKADPLDVTNMDSAGNWREFKPGLKDGGEVAFGVNLLPAAATHLAIIQDEVDGTSRNWRVEWTDAKVAATLDTGVVGSNNAITWTAVRLGAFGNDLTVALVDPGTTASLLVTVVGKTISVRLAYATGAITSTAAQVIAAIEASAAASALVTVADTSTSDGTGICAAVATTNLAGGRGSRWTLPAFVMSFEASAPVDGVTAASVGLKITGAPTLEGVS